MFQKYQITLFFRLSLAVFGEYLQINGLYRNKLCLMSSSYVLTLVLSPTCLLDLSLSLGSSFLYCSMHSYSIPSGIYKLFPIIEKWFHQFVKTCVMYITKGESCFCLFYVVYFPRSLFRQRGKKSWTRNHSLLFWAIVDSEICKNWH